MGTQLLLPHLSVVPSNDSTHTFSQFFTCRTLHFELLCHTARLNNSKSIIGLGKYCIAFFSLQDFLFQAAALGLVSLLGI